MILKNKTILIISPEPWDHIFVSKHHYATHLAKRGNQVYFLNPPSRQYRLVGSEYSGLKIIDYKGFLPGLRYLPACIVRWVHRKGFHQIEQIAGCTFDMIWSFDNSVFYLLDALPARIKISHIVDLNMDFQFKKAAKTADFCLGVTDIIVKKLRQFNSKSFKISHGLNLNHSTNPSFRLPGQNAVKALYLGNLSIRYFDWDIILEIILACPHVDFIFIGSNKEIVEVSQNKTHEAKKVVMCQKNTYFLDPIASSEIFSVLLQSQIVLVSYQQKYHSDQATNPHKVLEYLYSGKPIVATFTKEYEGLDLLYMSKENENKEWPDVFNHVLDNLDECASPEQSARRKMYALQHTYDRQIDRIESYINELK